MDKDSRTTGAVAQRFVKGFGIGVLGIMASLGLVDRVNATYLHVDFAPAYAGRYNAGDYSEKPFEWIEKLA